MTETPATKASAGDRLERSIEAHADPGPSIEYEVSHDSHWKTIRKTAFWVAITGISLYLVAPSLIEVLGSSQRLDEINPIWFPALAGLELLTLGSLWVLQRLSLPTAPISAVIDSQLAGNALSKIAPGGGAMGSALQYKMLRERGQRGPAVIAALTAVNLLTFALVLALPVLAVPALIGGSVDQDLATASLLSLGLFALLVAVGSLLMTNERALARTGRTIQAIRNRIRRRSSPLMTLPARLQRERDRLVNTLGEKWKLALAATAARWTFDYALLLAALAAVGAYPRPALVLLAFCAAQVLAQIPATPGGLGFVEAGLAATLALAGVETADAVLATFIYRLFTYWLPLPVGAVAFGLHQRHAARHQALEERVE